MLADVLAILRVPLVYESAFVSPARDTETYDVHFTAPALLHQAGVKVAFSVGSDSFGAGMTRNLPYAAAQAIAFGLPENEALKGLTLFPAELMGVADRVGSIEAGKDATVFICDGDLFDLRSNVQRMWIAGQEVSLGSRHTRLYEKYRNRPKP
jgi:imidazolonepropionase-like amidohydrolase